MTSYPTSIEIKHDVTDPDTVYELLSILEKDGTVAPNTLSGPWAVSDTFAVIKVSDAIHLGYTVHDDDADLLYIPNPTMVTAKVIGLTLHRSASDTALLTIVSMGREEDGEMTLYVTNLSMLANERLARFYGVAISQGDSE